MLRRVPFTAGLLVVLVLVAFLTGTHAGPLDPALRRLYGFAAVHLPDLEWYRIFTSLFLTVGGPVFWVSAAQAALFVGAAEITRGTRRTAAVFLGVHVLTLVLVALLLAFPLASLGVVRGKLLAEARDVGPSAGTYGCLGLALASLPRRARGAAFAAVLAFLAARLAWSFVRVPEAGLQLSAAAAHSVAFPLGFLASRLADRVAPRDLERRRHGRTRPPE